MLFLCKGIQKSEGSNVDVIKIKYKSDLWFWIGRQTVLSYYSAIYTITINMLGVSSAYIPKTLLWKTGTLHIAEIIGYFFQNEEALFYKYFCNLFIYYLLC